MKAEKKSKIVLTLTEIEANQLSQWLYEYESLCKTSYNEIDSFRLKLNKATK